MKKWNKFLNYLPLIGFLAAFLILAQFKYPNPKVEYGFFEVGYGYVNIDKALEYRFGRLKPGIKKTVVIFGDCSVGYSGWLTPYEDHLNEIGKTQCIRFHNLSTAYGNIYDALLILLKLRKYKIDDILVIVRPRFFPQITENKLPWYTEVFDSPYLRYYNELKPYVSKELYSNLRSHYNNGLPRLKSFDWQRIYREKIFRSNLYWQFQPKIGRFLSTLHGGIFGGIFNVSSNPFEGNEYRLDAAERYSLEGEAFELIGTMSRISQKYGFRLVVVQLPIYNPDELYPTHYTNNYINTLRRICKKNNVVFLNNINLISDVSFFDNFTHLNFAGHKILNKSILNEYFTRTNN